jgi:NADPH2:quinone reductase
MKAWTIDSLTGLTALKLTTLPQPTPAAGEVVLRVQYAGLNPADRYLAENQYPAKPPLPHVLGRDGVGTVVEVGRGVTGARVGDVRAILRGDVGVSRAGTFAEFVAVPADLLIEVPPGWSPEQVAGAPLVYLTAYQAISQWTDLPAGGVVLVTGASGGVGLASIQLARSMGFVPVGLSRDEIKWPTLRKNGAEDVFSPEDPGWQEKFYAKVGRRPTALAIDNIAGPLFPKVIDTMAQNGRVSVIGRLAGPVPEFNTGTLFFRRLRVGGVAVGTYTAGEARAAWTQILKVLAKTGAQPLVDQVFELGQLPLAFARLKAGPLGKVLVRVG